MSNEGYQIESKVNEIRSRVGLAMRSRSYRAANELRNASQLILRGQRSGRRYRVPGTKRHYTASAPGEPPAVRTGAFRAGWQPNTKVMASTPNCLSIRAYIESRTRTDNGKYLLGELLENGSGRMAPRPYREKIQEKARKNIINIYREPYM